MAFSVLLPTSDIQIIRITEALYNLRPGSTYLDNFKTYTAENGLEGFANALGNQFAESSNEDLAALVATNIHATGEEETAATTYLVAQFRAVEPEARGKVILDAVNLLAGNGSNASNSFNDDVKASLEYSKVAANTDVAASDVAADQAAAAEAALAKAAEALKLTTSEDNLTGTDGDDSFTAKIINNANTLQSGDVIDGGDGVDTLTADIGTSQAFAITAETTNVEKVVIRSEARAEDSDSNDNNMTEASQIDAERMVGVTHYESNSSRADLIIEDVKIEAHEITKDITIAMVATDPGDVDLGVYFCPESLRAEAPAKSGATLKLELMDTRSLLKGEAPLKESPYNGFTFNMDATKVSVASDAIDAAQTYDELLIAINDAIDADDTISAKITATKPTTFSVFDTDTGTQLTGDLITLTNSGPEVLSIGSWLTATGELPASSGLHVDQYTVTPVSTGNLITSKIILDDVGRTSNGGDLVVGSLSVGDDGDNGTSDSKGVEEFDITVEQSSILGNINSTNNTLREVFIENGSTKGNLTVNGHNAVDGDADQIAESDFAHDRGEENNDLPGDREQDNEYGFSDVRILDASKMEGWVNITAELTDNIVAKYLDRVDDANDPALDNSTFNPQFTTNKHFVYTLGTNNDTLAMDLSKSNAAATGTTSREDFELTIHGKNGDDTITTIIGDGEGVSSDHWYINSKQNSNLNVNGDAGNDTITTSGAGDVVINAGSGNDTVYTDNTGAQKATWAFNTDGDNNDATANNPVTDDDTQNNVLNDSTNNGGIDINSVGTDADGNQLADVTVNGLETDESTAAVVLEAGQLTVTFRGLTSTVTVASDATAHTTSALQVNQAIKKAINKDAVLSKLIVAQDGPSETLVVTALIDGEANVEGADDVTDLTVAITRTAAVSETVLEALNSTRADGAQLTVDTALTLMQQSATTLTNAYGSEFARDDAEAVIDGSDSNSTNDNTITGGTGDDVIVLSTDENQSSQETLVLSGSFGNDTVVNFNTAVDSQNMDNGVDVINLDAYKSGDTAFSVTAGNTTLSANNQILFTTFTDQVGDDALSHDAQVNAAINAAATANLSGVVFATNTGDNVAKIYTAASDGVNDAVLTLRGSINFADTNVADFVNDIANFRGAVQGADAPAPAPAPDGVTVVPLVDATTAAQAGVAEQFKFTAGSTSKVITGFEANGDNADSIEFDLDVVAGQPAVDSLDDLDAYNLTGLVNPVAVQAGVVDTLVTIQPVVGAEPAVQLTINGINTPAEIEATII